MADKYGPIFTIRLGMFPALIVSNHEAVKECFTTKDRVLANRPRSNAGIYLGYNHAGFGFAPYGEYWRQIRKLAVVELLSSRRLETLKHVQISESKLESLTLNTIMRLIAGRAIYRMLMMMRSSACDKSCQRVHVCFWTYCSVGSDTIPRMDGFCVDGTSEIHEACCKEIDSIVGRWVEEHKLKRLESEPKPNEHPDFIDLLLSAIEEDSMLGYTRETIIKATVMNLFLAGSDTTSITLTWILSNLMNNRNALKCAQEELDLKVGKDKWVQDSDIEKLVYLQAVIRKLCGYTPAGPISVPHEAREDCSIGGFHVGKGTRVIVNLWKLHRDPRVWSNPDVFEPERFLTRHEDVDVVGQHFELIPFGSGRRSCPGMTLALQMTSLIIARMLQGFELTTPFGEPVDMTEGLGITMPKATPLEVILTPRLPAAMYLHT
ncbi:ER lumen protein retaining receptor family protein isoform 1 [Hibiscus syriacus]|uniref:ER lumen protein retaining receptor family protein isoform 1 n=1 Tax=Hibiscus syriacus TaxID=106335 RepID=A0A6A2X1U1_HIBSY|nr:ER lumen protein retaining receptor family protein isoform 1 [Hibiscus syriacus]